MLQRAATLCNDRDAVLDADIMALASLEGWRGPLLVHICSSSCFSEDLPGPSLRTFTAKLLIAKVQKMQLVPAAWSTPRPELVAPRLSYKLQTVLPEPKRRIMHSLSDDLAPKRVHGTLEQIMAMSGTARGKGREVQLCNRVTSDNNQWKSRSSSMTARSFEAEMESFDGHFNQLGMSRLAP